MEKDDKILVCHHDWMPDGRIILQEGRVASELTLDDGTKVTGVTIFNHAGEPEGLTYVPQNNTSKDYYWLEEWDPNYKARMQKQLEADIKAGKFNEDDVDGMRKQVEKAWKEGVADEPEAKKPKRPRKSAPTPVRNPRRKKPIRVSTHRFKT